MNGRTARRGQDFPSLLASTQQVVRSVATPEADLVDRDALFPARTIAALQEAGVLSAPVPREFGGAGCTLAQQARLCATLAQGCGSSAMVLAMHFIQVGCLARHRGDNPYLATYLGELAHLQCLLASITSEVGTYGDTRSSVCSLEPKGDGYALVKDATTGSYCLHADAMLVTSRRSPDAAANDQVLVLVHRDQCTLQQTTSWDTLGMRGTCSPGFKLQAVVPRTQVLPGPYADCSTETMVPYSHVLWSAVWWGIAVDATAKAARHVRAEARRTPGTTPPSATRLAEVSMQLETMHNNWQAIAMAFDTYVESDPTHDLQSMAWALRCNHLKVSCAEAAPQIVQRALRIVGLPGYKNDSPLSLGRHLRDTLSASLMISNERITSQSASMLLVLKEAP